MKYIKVEWPEIQDYMNHPKYNEECYFDPDKNCWFIPEEWEEIQWWKDELAFVEERQKWFTTISILMVLAEPIKMVEQGQFM